VQSLNELLFKEPITMAQATGFGKESEQDE
jgi:hypothetical protein